MKRREFIRDASFAVTVAGHSSWTTIKESHILTLSFDDGFKKSFYRIAEIHEAHGLKACLNVIATGHLPEFNTEPKWIPQHLLGNFDDWNRLKQKGHEVMPHTWDHLDLTKIPAPEAKKKIDLCLDYFESHLEGYSASNVVYNFAYNASTPELDNYALRRVRAVRTGGWLVLNDKPANIIPLGDKHVSLGCWSHGPDACDEYVETEINKFITSPGGWLILNLHGLDEEGWGPVSTSYLDKLLKRLSGIDILKVAPSGEVLKTTTGR